MTQQIICAGFGGQGVMLMGQVLAYAGMIEDKHVSWLPSYGPEMRGGTANCNVIISDEPVGAPTVTEADIAMIMNKPSLEKFEKVVVPGGSMFVNTSLVHEKATRTDINTYYIAANELGNDVGTIKVANIVILGAYLEKCGVVSKASVIEGIKKVLGEKKAKFIPMNEAALQKGANSVK